MSYVDSAFAATPYQGGLLDAPPPQAQPAPQPAGVLSAPQAPPSPGLLGDVGAGVKGLLGLPVSYFKAIGSGLADVPDALAAQRVERDTHAQQMAFALQQARAIYSQVLAIQDPQQRMAALANLPEYGKALAQNVSPQSISGGQTEQFYGPDGPTVTAPLIGFDTASGKGTAVDGQGNLSTSTNSAGGDYSVGDGLIASKRTGEVAGTYSQPQKLAPGESPGSYTPTVNAPGNINGSAFGQGGGGGSLPPADGAAPVPGATGAAIDPIGFFKAFVLKHEGGLNPSDMNGSPTNYGINQAAHPEVNVRKLTPDGAAQIFKTDYWDKSGAANLPAPLAAVHADTAFINPNRANQFLQQSGGDWQKYMQLRSDWMGRLVATDPAAAKYADAWSKRNADLSKVAAGLAGVGGGASPLGPSGPSAGWSVGQPVGSGYKILTADQVPNGKPGWTYKQAPNGDLTPIAPDFTMADVQANRKAFLDSEQYKAASTGLAAFNGLDRVVSGVAPGGVVGMANLDTLNKALNPGGVVRPQTAQMFLDHLGLPEEMRSHLSGVVGTGPLSPTVIKQVGQAAWAYTKAHVDQANERARADVALAVGHGLKPEDAGEAAPQMPPVPVWAQDPLPPPGQRIPNHIYWSPKGPAKWTPKGWVLQ